MYTPVSYTMQHMALSEQAVWKFQPSYFETELGKKQNF